jgi:dipeptidyl aminopeptidase/acylaminoacyl peptidase
MLEWMNASVASGATLAGFGYVALCGLMAHKFTSQPERVPVSLPDDLPADIREVELHSRVDRLRISGWYLPAENARGAVVVAHGIGMNKGFAFGKEEWPLLRSLLQSGFSILAIDLRGHGQSEGARLSYGCHESRDVLGAVDWLLDRGYAAGRIGVLGASMGAAASITAAAQERAIAVVVADSAFADFGAMLKRNFLRQAPMKVGRAFLPGTMMVGKLLLGTYMHRFSPASHARALKDRPVMHIHAKGDRMVPHTQAAWLANESGGQLWLTEGGRHLTSCADQPQTYRERVCEFFVRHLGETQGLSHHRPAAEVLRATNGADDLKEHGMLVAA